MQIFGTMPRKCPGGKRKDGLRKNHGKKDVFWVLPMEKGCNIGREGWGLVLS